MAEPMLYVEDDWPHGLRCMDCGCLFVERMPICERLYAMAELGDDPVACVHIVCAACDVTKGGHDGR